MRIDDAIYEYLLEQTVRGNSPNTVKDYRTKLEMFRRFTGDVDVCELTLQRCREFYLELAGRVANSVSIQTYIRSLRAFLNWLYNNEYIEIDICKKFKLPKAKKPHINILTNDEINRMFDCFSGDSFLELRNRLILALMLDSGLRLGEVISARREDLHLKEHVLIVTGKGNKQRAVAFGSRTAEIFRKYLEIKPHSQLLIIKVSGFGAPEGVTESTIKDLFRKLKKKALIPRLHPHLLRHTFATRYLENGGNIYSLQLLLGHTSLHMTRRYVHLSMVKIQEDFVNFSPFDNVGPS